MAILYAAVKKAQDTEKLEDSDIREIIYQVWNYERTNIEKGIGKSLDNKTSLLLGLV